MTMFLDDGDVRLYHGDALEQLREMPSESVHTMVTSPPFFQLRDYGVNGQIGLEATLADWIASLVAVFAEAKRVLRSDATAWIEIGDSYAGKQLAGAPWRLAFALQEAGWFLRSDCIWARIRPNPMPESVTDRPTKAHSYVFLLTKSARYFYDSDSIREAEEGKPQNRHSAGITNGIDEARFGNTIDQRGRVYGAGRNARSVWSIPTEPTPFAHFATFPTALVERCIKAGCPEGGTVLDPFVGSGTTCLVARRLGRHAIGIELNSSYLTIAAKRLEQLSLLA